MSKKDKSEKKKSIFAEFREFISRGNVLDMAIGVIIASAFGKITTSLVNDVFMPLIGAVLGKIDLAALNITLIPAQTDGDVVTREAVVIGIGTFLTAVIDFLLVSLVVFLIVKTFNTVRAKLEKQKKEEEEKEEEEKEAEPTKEELLLTEIRDLLAAKNGAPGETDEPPKA